MRRESKEQNTQLIKYMSRVFFSYFFAIAIPISALAVLYISFSIPRIKEEQAIQYGKTTEADVQKIKLLTDRIHNFAYTLSVDGTLAEMQRGEYDQQVYYYLKMMDTLAAFNINNENLASTSIYIASSDRVVSPEFGVLRLVEFADRKSIDKLLQQRVQKSYSRAGNHVAVAMTMPYYYFDSSEVLLFHLDVEKLFYDTSLGNLIILSPNGELLYGTAVNEQTTELLSHIGSSPSGTAQIVGRYETLLYGVDEVSGLTMVRSYDLRIVSDIISSTVRLTIVTLSASLLIVCVIAFLLARANVHPVAKLSSQLRQIPGGKNGKTIFDNISNFLSEIQRENTQYQQRMQSNIAIVRDGAIRDLLWGRIPADYSISDFFARAGITDLPERFLPILIQVGSNLSKVKYSKTAEMNMMIDHLLEERLSEHFNIFGNTMLELDQIVYVLGVGETFSGRQQLNSVLDETILSLMEKLTLSIRVVVAYPVESSELLCHCLIGMRKQLNRGTTRDQNLLQLHEEDELNGQAPEYLHSSMVSAVRSGNRKLVESLLGQMFVDLKKYPDEEAGGMAFIIMGNVISSLTEYPEMLEKAAFDLLHIFGENIALDEKYVILFDRILKLTEKFRSDKIETEDNAYISNALIYINNNLHRDLSLSDIAQYIGINTSYFSRIFKANTGATPLQYITNLRMSMAKELLREGKLSIKDISQQLGYNDTRSFIRFFKKSEGCTPSEYKVYRD